MKYFGISILVGLFLAQVLSSSLIILNYEVNTSYIIENFCQNIDKPELECNGKCHLKKQIEADSEQKSDTPASPTETLLLVLAINDIPSLDLTFSGSDQNSGNSLYLEGEYSNPLQSIFHPPQV